MTELVCRADSTGTVDGLGKEQASEKRAHARAEISEGTTAQRSLSLPNPLAFQPTHTLLALATPVAPMLKRRAQLAAPLPLR